MGLDQLPEPVILGQTDEEKARQRELDDILFNARKEFIDKKQAEAISLPQLIGSYEAIEGHPGFYGRAPKLRQQIEIARISESAQASNSMAANLVETAEMARLAIFKNENGQMVGISVDEFLDEFDATETVGFLTKYLGLKTDSAGDAADPNAST